MLIKKNTDVFILLEHHRHGVFPHIVREGDKKHLYATALAIAKRRASPNDLYYTGHFYPKKDAKMQAAIKEGDGKTVWRLLRWYSKTYSEYHFIETVTPSMIE